ncbi:MAG: Spi family protease inhibitor [Bacteroidales bacterium]|nr:Spi family protease inhibitor [Bacteroidales bacterium]
MKKFFYLLALSLFSWGCSNDEPVQSQDEGCCEETTVSSQARTENEAFYCALKALAAMEDSQKGSITRAKRFSSTSRSGYSYTTQEWKEDDTTAFYIFNFDDGGFSIVSTNPKQSPVKALSVDNNFVYNENDPNDLGYYFQH